MYYTSNDGDILLYLLVYLFLRINMKAKICIGKGLFFYLKLSIVYISTNNVIGSLKACVHLGNTHGEGTVS